MFNLSHRAEGDDVAIVRNESGVELNLIFNANAGEPNTNVEPARERLPPRKGRLADVPWRTVRNGY
jgi:hypothetical protein